MPDHHTPIDAFGVAIHVGDTVVASAPSSTTSPGLIRARATGWTPSGELLDMVVTSVGADLGFRCVAAGETLRRRAGRVCLVARAEEVDP